MCGYGNVSAIMGNVMFSLMLPKTVNSFSSHSEEQLLNITQIPDILGHNN